MKASKARELSIKSKKDIIAEKSNVKEVLEKIKESAESGYFECNYWDDDEIREDLKLLGYTVSEKWTEDRWYGTSYMTIKW